VPLTTLTGSARGDIVHVDRIIGVGELALSDHRSSQPTLDELLRIASEAHVAGLMSGKAGVVHLHMGDGPRGLELVRAALDASEIPPRVFQPTHVNRRRALFEEACELTHLGCTIDVTAFPVRDGEDAWSAPEAIEQYFILGLDPTRITASSDGGGCLPVFDADGHVAHMDVGNPGDLSKALTELLAAGLALETVLPVFTSNWARLLRLPDKGRIAVGADADLCVLDDRHHIADVLCAGRWHVRKNQPLVLGSFEAIPNEHKTP
jgi:beta-aspartyl-dipeptidase (metallo-type)